MSIIPTFKLYQSDGLTLQYTFPVVFSANYPTSSKNYVEHTNFRGKGSIIIDGGEKSWDLILKGVLISTNYEALIALIDAMEAAVALNTAYILKIDKTASTTYSYNVKRVEPIQYEPDSLRTDIIEYTVTLRVNAW